MAKKWLDSIEKQKRSNLKFGDRRTDRKSQLLTIIDSSARRGDQHTCTLGFTGLNFQVNPG